MATDRPAHEPIRVRMADGSVYTLSDELRLRAFHATYGDEELETVLDGFRARVARHWADRTKPWKGLTLGWGEDPSARPGESFADHAELAESVMYAAIRAPLLAIVMAATADEPAEAPSVVAIGEDGIVEYAGDEAIEREAIDEIDDDGA